MREKSHSPVKLLHIKAAAAIASTLPGELVEDVFSKDLNSDEDLSSLPTRITIAAALLQKEKTAGKRNYPNLRELRDWIAGITHSNFDKLLETSSIPKKQLEITKSEWVAHFQRDGSPSHDQNSGDEQTDAEGMSAWLGKILHARVNSIFFTGSNLPLHQPLSEDQNSNSKNKLGELSLIASKTAKAAANEISEIASLETSTEQLDVVSAAALVNAVSKGISHNEIEGEENRRKSSRAKLSKINEKLRVFIQAELDDTKCRLKRDFASFAAHLKGFEKIEANEALTAAYDGLSETVSRKSYTPASLSAQLDELKENVFSLKKSHTDLRKTISRLNTQWAKKVKFFGIGTACFAVLFGLVGNVIYGKYIAPLIEKEKPIVTVAGMKQFFDSSWSSDAELIRSRIIRRKGVATSDEISELRRLSEVGLSQTQLMVEAAMLDPGTSETTSPERTAELLHAAFGSYGEIGRILELAKDNQRALDVYTELHELSTSVLHSDFQILSADYLVESLKLNGYLQGALQMSGEMMETLFKNERMLNWPIATESVIRHTDLLFDLVGSSASEDFVDSLESIEGLNNSLLLIFSEGEKSFLSNRSRDALKAFDDALPLAAYKDEAVEQSSSPYILCLLQLRRSQVLYSLGENKEANFAIAEARAAADDSKDVYLIKLTALRSLELLYHEAVESDSPSALSSIKRTLNSKIAGFEHDHSDYDFFLTAYKMLRAQLNFDLHQYDAAISDVEIVVQVSEGKLPPSEFAKALSLRAACSYAKHEEQTFQRFIEYGNYVKQKISPASDQFVRSISNIVEVLDELGYEREALDFYSAIASHPHLEASMSNRLRVIQLKFDSLFAPSLRDPKETINKLEGEMIDEMQSLTQALMTGDQGLFLQLSDEFPFEKISDEDALSLRGMTLKLQARSQRWSDAAESYRSIIDNHRNVVLPVDVHAIGALAAVHQNASGAADLIQSVIDKLPPNERDWDSADRSASIALSNAFVKLGKMPDALEQISKVESSLKHINSTRSIEFALCLSMKARILLLNQQLTEAEKTAQKSLVILTQADYLIPELIEADHIQALVDLSLIICKSWQDPEIARRLGNVTSAVEMLERYVARGVTLSNFITSLSELSNSLLSTGNSDLSNRLNVLITDN